MWRHNMSVLVQKKITLFFSPIHSGIRLQKSLSGQGPLLLRPFSVRSSVCPTGRQNHIWLEGLFCCSQRLSAGAKKKPSLRVLSFWCRIIIPYKCSHRSFSAVSGDLPCYLQRPVVPVGKTFRSYLKFSIKVFLNNMLINIS